MTWQVDDSQPRSGHRLGILVSLFAFVLAVAAAGLFYLHLSSPALAPLPQWLPDHPALVWFAAKGTPVVALGASVLGLLVMSICRVASPRAVTDRREAPVEVTSMERLRNQIAPLATGDLTIRLPEGEGALGDVALTLNLLIGGVSNLAATADEASARLLGLAEDARRRAANLDGENEQGQRLADEILEQARRASVAAHALAERIKGAEVSNGRPSRRTPKGTAAKDAAASLAMQMEGIVNVIADIADHAHVLAVEIGIQASAAGAHPALRGFGDEVQRLAEHAAGAVRQVEPLAQAVGAGADGETLGDRLALAPRQAASLRAAATSLAEQLAALPDAVARLRDIGASLAQVNDETAVALGAYSDFAYRLRRATDRFLLPG